MSPQFKYVVGVLFLIAVIPACDTELQLSNVQLHKSDKNMQYIDSFQIKECDKITLRYYKKLSDSRDGVDPKEKEIKDPAIISQLLNLTSKLPYKGDIMKKMGDVPLLNVILTINKSELVYFSFYNGNVKTPDTSFCSSGPAEEQQLYQLLMKLLNE